MAVMLVGGMPVSVFQPGMGMRVGMGSRNRFGIPGVTMEVVFIRVTMPVIMFNFKVQMGVRMVFGKHEKRPDNNQWKGYPEQECRFFIKYSN